MPPCAGAGLKDPGGQRGSRRTAARLGRTQGVSHRITGDSTLNRNKSIGWDAVHLAIDDHSRVSFAQVLPDEKAISCVLFLHQAVACYVSLGADVVRSHQE